LTGWYKWSINYVLPITTVSLHIFYFVMSIADMRNRTAYGIYFLMSTVGDIVVAGLFFAGVISVRPFAAISVGIGLTLLCFQLIFRWRTFTSEMHSRFHV